MSELHDEVDHEEHTDAAVSAHYSVRKIFEDAYYDNFMKLCAKNVNRFYTQYKKKLHLLETTRTINKAFHQEVKV